MRSHIIKLQRFAEALTMAPQDRLSHETGFKMSDNIQMLSSSEIKK